MEFLRITPKKKKGTRKMNRGYSNTKLDADDIIGFFTEDDYEQDVFKANVRRDLSIDVPEPPRRKKKFQGAKVEVGNGNFSLQIVFG